MQQKLYLEKLKLGWFTSALRIVQRRETCQEYSISEVSFLKERIIDIEPFHCCFDLFRAVLPPEKSRSDDLPRLDKVRSIAENAL
ncbi:MAG: hypothetical protein AB9866_22000 [Syntrophobacteraceae bacterium]